MKSSFLIVQGVLCLLFLYFAIFFHILFHYRLLLSIEGSFLCYTIGPCLSLLYTVVCIC